MIFAADFEGHRIAPGNQFPRPVCLSWCEIIPCAAAPGGYRPGAAGVMTATDGVRWLFDALDSGGCWVNFGVAFDAGVAIEHSAVGGIDREAMLRTCVAAYERGDVVDVALRQGLWEIATDTFAATYDAGSIAARCGTPTQPDKSEEWRLRYGELDGVPIEQYPQRAYTYARDDAIAAAEVFCYQQHLRMVGSPYFPGRDVFKDEGRQARKALALKYLSATGLRSDPNIVARYRAHLESQMAEWRDVLIPTGLVYRKYQADREAIADAARAAGSVVALTPTGKPSLTKTVLRQCADPRVRAFADWPMSAPYLVREGFATETFHIAEDAAKKRLAEAFRKLGKPVPLSATGAAKATSGVTSEIELAYASLDQDACEKSKDKPLATLSKYKSAGHKLSTDFSMLEQAAAGPLHAFYRVLQRTGRTSTGKDDRGGSKGNLQNMPRESGVRECYVPGDWVDAINALLEGWEVSWDDFQAVALRGGFGLIAEADWSAVELCTFSDICYRVLGWSALGDMINDGTDAHLMIAKEIAGVSYEVALERKEANDPEIDRMRTAGKGVQFGCKGGMGAEKFEQYAWNNYRVDCDSIPGGAARLIELHHKIVPEMSHYTEWVKSHAREPGVWGTKYDIVQPWSERLRAGLGYTDAHNSPFQGLASDLAGVALWDNFLATQGVGPLGKGDPIFGARPALFTHDSIANYQPHTWDLERHITAAERLGEIMSAAARKVIDRCPSVAEPCLQTRLSKMAKPITRKVNGKKKLVGVWDPHDQARKQAEAYLTDPETWLNAADAGVFTLEDFLRKKKWPPCIIEDTLNPPTTVRSYHGTAIATAA